MAESLIGLQLKMSLRSNQLKELADLVYVCYQYAANDGMGL